MGTTRKQGCSNLSYKKVYVKLGLSTHLNSQLTFRGLRQELEASLRLQSERFCLERKTDRKRGREEGRKERKREGRIPWNLREPMIILFKFKSALRYLWYLIRCD